jgi:hypothetical protein
MQNICHQVQFGICNNSHSLVYPSKKLRFEARGLRVNSALPSSLLLLLFFLPFTWGRHRRAPATTALPVASSLIISCEMKKKRIFLFITTKYN